MVGERCIIVVLQVLCAVYGAHGTIRHESEAPLSATRSHRLERQAKHDSDLEVMTEGFPLGLPWEVTPNGTTRNVNKALPSSHRKDDSAITTDRRITTEFSHAQIRVEEYDHNHSVPLATAHALTIQAATLLPTITVTGANSRLTTTILTTIELTSMKQSTTKQETMSLSPTTTAAMTKAATTPETTSVEPTITNITTMAVNNQKTTTMEPTITDTMTTSTTTSTTPETTTMEHAITNTTTTTTTSTTPDTTTIEPTITNTTTTTTTPTTPETTTMEPTITNTTTTTSTTIETTTMEPTITNTTTTTTTPTTPETTTMEPTIANTTTTTSTTIETTMESTITNITTTTTASTTPETTTMEPTITNTTTTTTTSTTPETTTIESTITNTKPMKTTPETTTSEMTTTSLKTETATERTTTSPATITSRPRLAKIQAASSPPTTTSSSHGIAFDEEQTNHPQPLPRRCPVTSTENTLQRKKKSAPYLADVEEDITEHDDKASSASPPPYDELRGGRHVEDATLFPEDAEDTTAEEDEAEEELVKSTIQKLKALIEGKHRNETTKKRKENDAHLSSHFRFMTLTYLDKLRKIGKKKIVTEPPTANTTASPKTEIIRGARPTEGMDMESYNEESLSENGSRSDNDTHFSTLEEVKAEDSHESALTNSTTPATRPEMHKLPTTSELKQKTSQNQTSGEPSDRDLYFDTRRYFEGVRARTRNRLPATRPPQMDEFPTTPELKPEIEQNQTSEEPSDRDLYLDTRRYLEGVRERTRNRLSGINNNLAPENITTTTINTTATTASTGTSIGASDSTTDLTLATYPIMHAFTWDSLEFTTNISDTTTNPIISNTSLAAAAASTNTTSPSLVISSTNIATSPLQSLETTEFTNSTTSTSETFAGYPVHDVYPVLLSLDISDTTANTATKAQPFLTEETNTKISKASIVSESNSTTTTSPPSSPPPLEIITTVPLTSTSEEPSLANKTTTSLASFSPPPEVITTVSLPSTPEKPSLPMNTTTSGNSTITLPSPSPPDTRSTQTPMTNDTTPTETYTSNTTTTTSSSVKHTSILSTNTPTSFTTPRSKATTAVPGYTINITTPSQTVAGVNATVITADASIKEAASIIHRDMSKSTVILLGISLIGVVVLMTGGIILYRKRRQLQRWAPFQGRYTPRNWHQDV